MMKIMKLIRNSGTIIVVTIIQIVAFIIATQIIQFGPGFALTQEEASQSGSILAAISLINSIIIFYFFRRVKNTDYKLLFWFIFTWYGIGTIVQQLDTWYYIDAFPLLNNSLVLKIFLMQFINTILVIPASFFIVSRKSNDVININIKKVLNLNILKYFLFISIVYVLLYYLAGYFIAWQFDAIRVHYTGSLDKLSFFDHTLQLIKREPDFFPFHILRGVLWFSFGIPLFMALSKRKKEYYIYSFFLFALLPSLQLFLPNPLMSEAVRMGHFIEGFISNGIFGIIAARVWQKYESQLSNSL